MADEPALRRVEERFGVSASPAEPCIGVQWLVGERGGPTREPGTLLTLRRDDAR